MRLLGVNLCFQSAVPPIDEAPLLAERLAGLGINSVRLHHIDNRRALLAESGVRTGIIDPAALTRFDRLCAELIKRGIFLNLNLVVSRNPAGEDNGDPTWRDWDSKLVHLLAFWDAGELQRQRDYARQLLTHVNPQLGSSYAQHPGVAVVELLNENGLVNYFLTPRRRPDLAELPPRWRAPLERAWAAAGGSATGALPSRTAYASATPSERRAWIAFLAGLERDYYRGMRDWLRQELGVRALIIGSTAASSHISIQAELDAIDGHLYIDNPLWRGWVWDYAGRDWSIADTSAVGGSPGGRLFWLACYRAFGLPAFVTEYNHSQPNRHAGEAVPFLAAQAAAQDWDALYYFDWTHPSPHTSSGLNISSHPAKLAWLPMAARIFRDELVAPAPSVQAVDLHIEQEIAVTAAKGRSWQLCHGGDLGLDPAAFHQARLGVRLPGATAPLPRSGPPQVYRDDAGKAAALVVDAPDAKAVLGAVARRRFDLGGIGISVAETRLGTAAVGLALMEGPRLGAAGARALAVASGAVENSGMRWRQRPDQRWELDSWGHPPVLAETPVVHLDLPGRVAAWRLDAEGRRGEALAITAHGAGSRVTLDGALWYEVVWLETAPPITVRGPPRLALGRDTGEANDPER